MALTINRTLRDDDSRATFEIVSNGGAESSTIVEPATLTGSNGDGVDMVKVVGLTCLVCDNSGGGGNVTLLWDDGTTETAFLTLPVGLTNLKMAFSPPTDTYSTADINLTSSDTNISFTLRLVVEKVRGFDLSTVNRLI
jgi:hypothetical protein